MILAMYYKPDPNSAYESIRHITDDLWAGWLVRGMHRWGASVFIILLFLHMGRVFLYGAYKYPRELNWIVGALILVLGMMEGFFGYLLPWDQTAYWATVVGVNLQATGPFVGPFLGPVLQGGHDIGPDTLARFYSLHMLVIPGALAGLIGLHLWLVVRIGVSSPPWSPIEAGTASTRTAAATEEGARRARPERGEEAMNRRLEERRAQYARYKHDVKKRGKPFFPYAMFHDTVMSLLVVCVIVGPGRDLEVLDAARGPELVGLAREALRREGRSGDDELRPAAGLVLLLPLLPAADLQVARVGDPRHGHDSDDPDRAPDRAARSSTSGASGGRCGGRWR